VLAHFELNLNNNIKLDEFNYNNNNFNIINKNIIKFNNNLLLLNDKLITLEEYNKIINELKNNEII